MNLIDRAKQLLIDSKDLQENNASFVNEVTKLLTDIVESQNSKPIRWIVYHDDFVRAEISKIQEAKWYESRGFRVVPLYTELVVKIDNSIETLSLRFPILIS